MQRRKQRTSSGSEYLFAVDLLLDQEATVDWLNIPTGWDSTLPISSILFLSGGAAMEIRRYLRIRT